MGLESQPAWQVRNLCKAGVIASESVERAMLAVDRGPRPSEAVWLCSCRLTAIYGMFIHRPAGTPCRDYSMSMKSS